RLSLIRGCGGIGRRARFRSVSGKPGGGSSPLIRITRLPGAANENGRRIFGGRSLGPGWGAVAQRPVLRRWRRCAVTIVRPIAISSRPPAIVQRRSKPVKGSVEAFFAVGSVDVLGSLA